MEVNINKYYNQLQSQDILLSYKGSVNNELIDCLLQLTENKLSLLSNRKGLRKKIYTIVVEVLQNIYHHFDPKYFSESEDLESIAFVIGKESADNFSIIAGNYVDNDKLEMLKSVIDELNELTPEDLKRRYREALDDGTFTEKGGAGIGLLFIARKSGSKLEYVVKEAPLNHSFFSLKVKISD